MALNFPANPVDGQAFGNYTYNSSKGVWSSSATPPRYTVSANVPASAVNGDVWFNSETARSYIYYEDSDSSQWVEIGGSEGAAGVAASLGSIPGVDLTGLADGDTLVYDVATSSWIPGEAGGKFTVSDTAPVSAENGDTWFKSDDGKTYIYYVDADGGQWVEIASNTTGYLDIGQLNDVTIVSPTTGQALTYDGTNWVNATPASTLDSLTDVDTTGVADGQALVYDSATSEWSPADVSVDIYDVDNASTGYFSIPRGTTAQRPQNPIDGFIRFNTETKQPEWYLSDNDAWYNFRETPAFGLEYVVIAGGGGGGYWYGGGGGAGGYRSSITGESSGGGAVSEAPISISTGLVCNVTIGSGGTSSSSTASKGGNGSNSVFYNTTSIGGGGGGSRDTNTGASGGSGGGAASGGAGGAGTVLQGFNGAPAISNEGGGGGGAAGIGSSSPQQAGGPGLYSSVTGVSVGRAGGGTGHNEGAAGEGGGNYGQPGTANTGGGGGGDGGAGGSGIVILKYPAQYSILASAGLTTVTSLVGSDKVTQITAGTGTVTFS